MAKKKKTIIIPKNNSGTLFFDFFILSRGSKLMSLTSKNFTLPQQDGRNQIKINIQNRMLSRKGNLIFRNDTTIYNTIPYLLKTLTGKAGIFSVRFVFFISRIDSDMKKYHTIIIGAGPGGLACGTLLARQGLEVLVLERNERIGPKVCAGGIPTSALAQKLPEDKLEKSFSSQRIFTNWQQTTIHNKEPIIHTVDRGRLGRWMEEEARQAGVTIKTSSQVIALDAATVSTKNEKFAYQNLVGADGSSSLVRRYLNIPSQRVGVGINYQIAGDFHNMEWHLNTALFGNGYAWIFPHQSSASIGVYASRSEIKPKILLNSLYDWSKKFNIELKTRQPRAALINFDYRGWHFDNRFLIGDAAGLASGLTGEGIYSAIISGEEVAQTIIDPKHKGEKINQLIKKHTLHTKVLNMASNNSLTCTLVMESMVLGLRAGLINFKELEMGSD
jgi:geranylgeranyl reductase